MSDIPRALFEVGEQVIAVGHISGLYYDGIVHQKEYMKTWKPNNSNVCHTNVWIYKIVENGWTLEKNVRKKHKPGDSFHQLMSNLKNPSHIWQES